MPMVKETNSNFASFSGSPSSSSVYEKLPFDFKATNVKILVTAGSLDVSLNGTDATPNMVLAVGQYDFPGLEINALFVKQTGATAQILAWTN